ncbi:MAG: cytochrome b/b6 domain-containing protein [Pseudomonadota bacterium]
MQTILVWDWPVRIGHWLLAGAFALAWLTGDSEEWRLVHAFAGGTVAGVVLFRLAWGVIGTHHARFTSFIRGPRAVLLELAALLNRQPLHSTGHNAPGGWAILALLGLGLLTAASGWAVYQEAGGEWLEEAHEVLANGMLLVVLLHVAGVVTGSLAHGENLVRAMFTGRKTGQPGEAIAGSRPLAALVLLGWAAAVAWWLAR